MKTVQDHIKTVKNQIDFYDYKIKKHPKNTCLQAKFWTLKYDFEQLLAHLKNSSISEEQPLKEQASFTANSFPFKTRSAVKEEAKKLLLDVITRAGSDGIHIEQMFEELNTAHGVEFTLSKVKNYVSDMYRREGILDWVSKGIYRSIFQKTEEEKRSWAEEDIDF